MRLRPLPAPKDYIFVGTFKRDPRLLLCKWNGSQWACAELNIDGKWSEVCFAEEDIDGWAEFKLTLSIIQ